MYSFLLGTCIKELFALRCTEGYYLLTGYIHIALKLILIQEKCKVAYSKQLSLLLLVDFHETIIDAESVAEIVSDVF